MIKNDDDEPGNSYQGKTKHRHDERDGDEK